MPWAVLPVLTGLKTKLLVLELAWGTKVFISFVGMELKLAVPMFPAFAVPGWNTVSHPAANPLGTHPAGAHGMPWAWVRPSSPTTPVANGLTLTLAWI